jgi:hypothetical protein
MKKLIIIILLLSNVSAFSQKDIANQKGAWLMYFGNHKLTEKFSLHTEYQFRRSDYFNNWQQSLARIGLDYHFDKENAITAGYGWIVSFPYGEQPIGVNTTEHRIWQQFINQTNTGRLYFHHRYRLEQRFIEDAFWNLNKEKQVDGFKFRQRARYRFMISVPITRNKMEDNTLFLSLYDEVFLGFGQGIGKNILDQNRLYGAIGWKFNSKTNVQLGYLNQFIVKSNGLQMERNHNLQISWTYNMNFKK